MLERENYTTFVIAMWGMYLMGVNCYESNGSAAFED